MEKPSNKEVASAIADRLKDYNVMAVSAENKIIKVLYKGNNGYKVFCVATEQVGKGQLVPLLKLVISEDRAMQGYKPEIAEEQKKAIATAEKVLGAVAKKLNETLKKQYVPYVRHIAGADLCFIELALRPQGGHQAHETSSAYSEQYFIEANQDNIQDKAKRIFKDFKVLFGAL